MYEDLLQKNKVDLAWFGHYHSYERTCPLYKGECKRRGKGTVHMTIGSAGASLDSVGLLGKNWSMYFDDDFGIARVTVKNRTALHWEFVRNKDERVTDEMWIYRDGAGTVKTKSGCTCKQPWGQEGGYGNFYDCRNPDGDPNGTWCFVDEADCGQPTSNQKAFAWDYCLRPAQKTTHGCTCKDPFLYGNLKYYGCSEAGKNVTYSWCYVGEEHCGSKGSVAWWDTC